MGSIQDFMRVNASVYLYGKQYQIHYKTVEYWQLIFNSESVVSALQ